MYPPIPRLAYKFSKLGASYAHCGGHDFRTMRRHVWFAWMLNSVPGRGFGAREKLGPKGPNVPKLRSEPSSRRSERISHQTRNEQGCVLANEKRTATDERELKKLKRSELLEIMLAQSEEIERLRNELSQKEEELNQRRIAIEQSGSIAEASLRLTRVFEEAQRAADLYLANVAPEAASIGGVAPVNRGVAPNAHPQASERVAGADGGAAQGNVPDATSIAETTSVLAPVHPTSRPKHFGS